jgi:hypothetical protein
MRSFASVLTAALAGSALARPFDLKKRFDQTPRAVGTGFTVAHGGSHIMVTDKNTLNGTKHNHAGQVVNDAAVTGSLPLSFVNNFAGSQVNAYIQGADSTGAVVFIDQNGNTVYPSSGGSSTPVPITQDIAIPLGGQGTNTTVTIPITMSSGRVYFSEGDLDFYMVATAIGEGVVQPAPTNINGTGGNITWGFVELTYTTAKAVYANISYVDFVGMLLSMMLTATDGSTQLTKALEGNAAAEICADLSAQTAADGNPWASECITDGSGNLIRILSPGNYDGISGGAFDSYWDDYVDQVWTQYTSQPLTIDTQDPSTGNVTCQVSGDNMTCSGSSASYAKPTADDIFGCNTGPFSQSGADSVSLLVIPRLCAAFERSTLLLSGGNVQPFADESQYYSVSPTNYYCKTVHANEADDKGYSFSYDDVHPDGGNDSSGLISTGDPAGLTIYVGGYTN